MTRTCAHCGETKPLAQYRRKGVTRSGSPRWEKHCAACSRLSARERYALNPEAAKEAARRAYRANPERAKANAKARRTDPARAEQFRSWSLRKRYGIDGAEYDRMHAEQDGKCAICGGVGEVGVNLAVDHNHESGELRELLCRPCNLGLGSFRDDAERLTAAAKYLHKHAKRKVGAK